MYLKRLVFVYVCAGFSYLCTQIVIGFLRAVSLRLLDGFGILAAQMKRKDAYVTNKRKKGNPKKNPKVMSVLIFDFEFV